MKLLRILKIILKNALFFIIGSVIGLFIVIQFVLPMALEEVMVDKNPGEIVAVAIALTPVFLIIYGLFGIFFGGIGCVLLYNLVKIVLRRKEKNSL
jgi:hypothetical protein